LGERLGAPLQHAKTGVLRDFDCVPENKYKSKRWSPCQPALTQRKPENLNFKAL
jgi:hypothetical protein